MIRISFNYTCFNDFMFNFSKIKNLIFSLQLIMTTLNVLMRNAIFNFFVNFKIAKNVQKELTS